MGSAGCGATSYHLVVAGGVSEWDEILTSVEIFDLKKRSSRKGASLRTARAYFKIIPIGFKHPRLLAIGGRYLSSNLKTTEWWDEDGDSWEVGPSLATGRASFDALTAPPHLVCLETTDPLVHSCPAGEETDLQNCVFSAPENGISAQMA